MSLNMSFFGKACLVVATDESLCSLIATSLHQIGFADVVTVSNVHDAVQSISSAAYNLIICAGTNIDEPLDMVRHIRMDVPEEAEIVPLICIVSHMDVGNLAMMLNSGANCVMTLPISTRSMLKNVNRALNDKREIISKPSYRGPSRRNPIQGPYEGTRRRAADRQEHTRPPPIGGVQVAVSEGATVGGGRRARAVVDHGELFNSQTSIILNGVNEIAARIEYLKQALHATDNERTRKDVRAEIMEAAQRLVNLVALVDLNKNLHRNGDAKLHHHIDRIMALFVDILRQMSCSRLDTIIADMEKYLHGGEIALGCSDLLLERLASVEEIVAVLGGRKVDEGLKGKLDLAWDGIGKLQKMEAGRFELADLAGKRRSGPRGSMIRRPVEVEAEAEGVASQNGVANRLRSRGDDSGKKP